MQISCVVTVQLISTFVLRFIDQSLYFPRSVPVYMYSILRLHLRTKKLNKLHLEKICLRDFDQKTTQTGLYN